MENRRKKYQKRKKKRQAIRRMLVAGVLAGTVGITAIVTNYMNAEASSAMMPGIETIIGSRSKDQPFRILEVVNSEEDAEIGYLVTGQEPYLKKVTYTDGAETKTATSFEEALSVLPSKEARSSFADSVSESVQENSYRGSGREADYPFSYSEYKEAYFLSGSDRETDWQQVNLRSIQSDTLAGHYQENVSGNGDYTRQEQSFHPIRMDAEGRRLGVDTDGRELYRENIESFYFSDNTLPEAPYTVTFAGVSNETVRQQLTEAGNHELNKIYDYQDISDTHYGYYENVYGELTTEITDQLTAPEKIYMYPGEFEADERQNQQTPGNEEERLAMEQRIADIELQLPIGGIRMQGERIANPDTGEVERTVVNNPTTSGTRENPYVYMGYAIDEYPYYRYVTVGDLEYVMEHAVAWDSRSSKVGITAGTITKSDDQYWYWTLIDHQLEQNPLYIVKGRRLVERSQVQPIPDEITYPYYFQVSQVSFDAYLAENENETNPQNLQYRGWYYSAMPENQEHYIPVDETSSDLATYYISTAEYKLTPGSGTYDFIPDANDEPTTVELDHIFYQGGYVNHDWLKRYVFHLSPEDSDETVRKQFEEFAICVDTVVLSEDESASADLDYSAYDLIYVNGALNSTDRVNLCEALTVDNKPCIFRQKKLGKSGVAAVKRALSAYLDSDYATSDREEDFVNKQIYFFGMQADGYLVSKSLKEKLPQSEAAAYHEISKYIEQENTYRKTIESGKGTTTQALSEEITTARVIEYIVNYQYKRVIAEKTALHVLDIEPADPSGTLHEDTVEGWCGNNMDLSIKQVCCYSTSEGKNGGIDLILDGDDNTYWHSRYNTHGTSVANHRNNDIHWITLNVNSNGNAINKVYYTPRKSSLNGTAKQFTFTFYDQAGRQIGSPEQSDVLPQNDRKKTITLKKSYANVASVKVTFSKTYGSTQNAFGSCAELRFGSDQATDVTVDAMTTLEYVGRLDDLNAKYDMIYFGAGNNGLRRAEVNGKNNTNLYAHVGAINTSKSRSDHLKLMGILDTEYNTKAATSKSRFLYDPTDTSIPDYDNVGMFRGSGNDITKQQLEELKSFVSSGYPIVIADGLLTTSGGRKIVNTNVVDQSSFVYEFLQSALTQNNGNVMAESEAAQKVQFYLGLNKPEIVFSAIPPEPNRLNDDGYLYNEGMNAEGRSVVTSGNLEGDGLEYAFALKNESEISAATATYHCELFIDLNFDGNLSDLENQSQYIEIRDVEGHVVSTNADGKYELKLNTPYKMTRKIPKDYYKIITWKMQISNNSNPYIRTSAMGYTKRRANENEKQDIHVLQIRPTPNNLGANLTWNLSTDTQLRNLLNQVEDFNIQITTITTSEYVTRFKENPYYLNQYQMLIMGFADGYGRDSVLDNEPEATQAIGHFIDSGKSAIFAHDTSSYVNYGPDVSLTSKKNNGTDGLRIPSNSWRWGYALNTYLRPYLGMDRYGVTSEQEMTLPNGTSTTVGKELKKGKALSSEVKQALEANASDMAYEFGSRDKTYVQTHGYSNYVIDDRIQSRISSASKVNEGAMTQYPFHLNETLNTASTHAQYYQLAMEEDSNQDGKNDIVVWYCLNGGSYDKNDVRNGYYYYSKGNVIYTGVGHASGITDDEKKLFVNSIVAAAQVVAVEPEVTLLEEFNPAAKTEKVRYFTEDLMNTNSENILEENMSFNVKIRDYNMAASDLSSNDSTRAHLSMEVYMEDSGNGTRVADIPENVRKISGENITTLDAYTGGQIQVNSNGVFELSGNDTFRFDINDIEQYLRVSGNRYKDSCTLYVKVTSKITLYGVDKTSTSVARLEIKPRQLFNLN